MSKFRRRLMIGGVMPVTTLVPYIRGGADGSYIDTGITPDSTTKVIVWARNVNPGSTWLFGGRVSTTESAFGLWAGNNQYSGSIQYRFGSNGPVVNDLFPYLSHYGKYELSSEGLKINDVLIDSLSSPGTFNSSYNLVLFGMNTAGTIVTSSLPIDICACKIYKNDTLVRDFTAVESPSVGLYDAVSDTVFTNAGAGAFTYGTFNPKAYTPLEYITCTGLQWLDTGIKGTYALPIVCACTPTSDAVFHELLGYRASNSCCCLGFGNASEANTRLYWRFGTNETTTYPYNNQAGTQTDSKLTIVKSNAKISVYKQGAELRNASKSGVANTFQTADTLYLGRTHNNTNSPFIGRLYFAGFGSLRNYVPAKVGGVAGMWDTYNDVFYASISQDDFLAGPAPYTVVSWGTRPDGSQGMAIYGDIMVSMKESGATSVYRMNTDGTTTLLGSFTRSAGHANALQFAPDLPAGRTLPYLYVAALDPGGVCYVLDIDQNYTSASIVQTITVPGGYQVLMGDDGYIWQSSSDSATHRVFTKYRHVALSEGASVELTSEDVIDSFATPELFPSSRFTAQGWKVKNGKVWFVYGASGTTKIRGVNVYEATSGTLLGVYNVSDVISLEPEDIDFLGKDMIMATYSTQMYKLIL